MSADRDLRRAVDKGERAAIPWVLKGLVRSVGAAKTMVILLSVARAKARGEPFGPAPRDLPTRDKLSRRQCGDLVLLDRALAPYLSEAERVDLLRGVVTQGGLVFLDEVVPRGRVDELLARANELTSRFFNAVGVMRVEGESLHFDVSRCLFVELLSGAGALHLAPLFCEVDESFFDGERRPVRLVRTQTLARDGAPCNFRFSPIHSGPRAAG